MFFVFAAINTAGNEGLFAHSPPSIINESDALSLIGEK